MRVLFIGAVPPPVHGMSIVNSKLIDFLKINDVSVVNTAAVSAGAPRWAWFISRVCQFVKLYFVILVKLLKGVDTVYFSVSGGAALFMELPVGILLFISGKRVVVHHHSFSYYNKRRLSASAMFGVLLKSKDHVVLGAEMKAALLKLYRVSHENIYIVSNTAFVASSHNASSRVSKDILKFGYISNISVEKGIDYAIELVECLSLINELGLKVEMHVAGPILDSQKDSIDKLIDKEFVYYYGPVYGEEKESFFDKFDMLLFPSRYVNEAEPLVVIEGLEKGKLVFASDVGCVNSLLPKDQILSFNLDNDIAAIIGALELGEIVDNSLVLSKIIDNSKKELNRLCLI